MTDDEVLAEALHEMDVRIQILERSRAEAVESMSFWEGKALQYEQELGWERDKVRDLERKLEDERYDAEQRERSLRDDLAEANRRADDAEYRARDAERYDSRYGY